jgi:hypothetical protein
MAVDVKERAALVEEVELVEEAETHLSKKHALEAQQMQWEKDFFEILDKVYKYTDKEKVIGFLKEHKEVWEILLGAPYQIRKYFGSPLRLTLDLFVNPEYLREKSITVYFATKLSSEERLTVWEKLYEDAWWDKVDEHIEYIHFHDTKWQED